MNRSEHKQFNMSSKSPKAAPKSPKGSKSPIASPSHSQLTGDEHDQDLEELLSSNKNNCRMYENRFPEVDDLVVVQVKSIAEMGTQE